MPTSEIVNVKDLALGNCRVPHDPRILSTTENECTALGGEWAKRDHRAPPDVFYELVMSLIFVYRSRDGKVKYASLKQCIRDHGQLLGPVVPMTDKAKPKKGKKKDKSKDK